MSFTGNYICEAGLSALASSYFGGSNVFKCALYTNAASLNDATAGYTTAGEVSGPGYSAGGAVVTPTVLVDGTTVVVTFSNPSWSAATFTAPPSNCS